MKRAEIEVPKLKRWYAVIDDPDAPVVNVTLYQNPEGLSRTAVTLLELPATSKFLYEVKRFLQDCGMVRNWCGLQRMKAVIELEKANARIKELEDYINNAKEDNYGNR